MTKRRMAKLGAPSCGPSKTCVAVALPDGAGGLEERFFLVEHHYNRPLEGCYEEPVLALPVEYAVPCLDSPF